MKEYNGYKKAYIDIETTGTDRKLHHIFQLSGAITDENDVVLEEFDFRFRPHELIRLNLDAVAIEHTGMTYEKLEALPMSSAQAFEAFIGVLARHCNRFDKKDKMQFIAYNAKFDDDFLRVWFELNGDSYYGSWFWSPPICVMMIAAFFLIDHRGALPNFKLGTLCQAAGLGWEEDKAHDAQYDIKKTRELFHYLRENTKVLGE
jgi:DNA polymerase III alpha subunit (gram-positive type)